jgi:preprotein translocase subunit SecA
MNFINKILKVFVGDKSQKDLKEIQPLVDKIKKIEPTLAKLSHDELRAKTNEFKAKITASVATIKDTIASLTKDIEATTDIDKKRNFIC